MAMTCACGKEIGDLNHTFIIGRQFGNGRLEFGWACCERAKEAHVVVYLHSVWCLIAYIMINPQWQTKLIKLLCNPCRCGAHQAMNIFRDGGENGVE